MLASKAITISRTADTNVPASEAATAKKRVNVNVLASKAAMPRSAENRMPT